MNNEEKFEGLKKRIVDDNEKKYGKEVRKKYGNKIINQSNQRVLKMTQEEYNQTENLAQEVKKLWRKPLK